MSITSALTIPPASTLNAVAERKLVAAGARTVVPVTFGTDIVTGRVRNVLPAAAGSSTLLVQVQWGHGTIQGIDQERLNDQALAAGSTVTHFLGNQTTTHAPLVSAMAAQGITYTATLAGFAYSVFAIPVRSFTGQMVFTARVQGLRLYDPRLDSTNGGSGTHRLADPTTWAWSDNPALADARWLSDTVFGCGETVNWASVITAANACDALIGSPAERRRIIGLTIDRPVRVEDQAEAMRAYAGCWHLPGPTGIRLVPDTTGTSQASYSHAAGTLLRISDLTSRDLGGAPTAVEVIWTDTSKRPARDGPPAIASLPGAGTTVPYRLSQVRLPGITRYSQAVREATERLNKLNLGDLGATAEWLDEGIRHEAADLIDLSHPVGLTSKVFRVATPPEMVSRGRYQAQVVEYDPAMYSTIVATGPTVPDTLLINPAGPPPDVTGVTAAVIPGAVRISIPAYPAVDIVALEIRRGASWAAGVRLEDGTAGSTSAFGTLYDWSAPPVASHTLWLRWRDRDGNLSVNAVSLALVVTASALGTPYTDVVGRPGTWRVAARGGSSTSHPIDAGLYNGETGIQVVGKVRSYMLIRISRATGLVVFQQTYDVFGNGAGTSGRNAATLAGDLNGSQSDVIVLVYTWDEPSQNRLTSGLAAAMYRCGASRAVFGSPQFQTGSAYVLVGVGGCGEGNGFEVYQGAVTNDTNAWVDVAFTVTAGNLIVTGTGATPRTLADYSYTGDLDATRGAPAGTLVAGTDAATLVSTANTAASQAAAATAVLASITSDGVLSQPEKPGEIIRYNDAVAERPGIDALAASRGITTERTAYTNAYNAIVAYMATLTSPVLWSDLSGTTTIIGPTYRANWDAYNAAKVALLRRIEASPVGGGNRIPNSSFEADSNADGIPDGWSLLTGGTVTGAAASLISGAGAPHGNRYALLSATTLGGGPGDRMGLFRAGIPFVSSQAGPFTATVFAATTVNTSAVNVLVNWYNASSGLLGTFTGTPQTLPGGFRRYTWTGTAPAGTASCEVFAFICSNSVAGSAAGIALDAVQIEPGEVPTAYAPRGDELLPGVVTTPILAPNAATQPGRLSSASGSRTWTPASDEGGVQVYTDIVSGSYTNDTPAAVDVEVTFTTQARVTTSGGASGNHGLEFNLSGAASESVERGLANSSFVDFAHTTQASVAPGATLTMRLRTRQNIPHGSSVTTFWQGASMRWAAIKK